MSTNITMFLTMFASTVVELGLVLILFLVFLRARDMRQCFSAMVVYFFLRVVEGVCANLLFLSHYAREYGILSLTQHQVYLIYFYAYWGLFLISAIVIFYALLQLYSAAMAPLPGLKSLGRRVFCWAGSMCLLMAFTAGVVPLKFRFGPGLLLDTAMSLMRCVSVLEICLLAILVFTVNKLGLGYRSRIFGISLGLGVYSVQYLIISAVGAQHSGMFSWLNITQEMLEVMGLGIWLFYGLRSEPARKPIMLPVTSPLIRWNEIAVALGFGEAKIAMGGTPSNYYLTDVEKAVGDVMGGSSLKKSVSQMG